MCVGKERMGLGKILSDIIRRECLQWPMERRSGQGRSRLGFGRVNESLGGCMVVWVTVDEKLIKERLAARLREGYLLKEPLGMYLAMKKDLDDFDDADIHFENNEPLDISADKLTKLIKHRLL
jgi:hypothetical protein